MANWRFPTKIGNQSGFTLIEMMIAAALGGFLFYSLMTLLGQSTNFAAYFHGAANSIEGTSEAISQLNAIMPQMVRVNSCSCNDATDSTSMAKCLWKEPTASDPSIGKDPVQTYGLSSTGNGLKIFDGDFEWFAGNAPATGQTALEGLWRSNLTSTASTLGGCLSLPSTFTLSSGTFQAKGCKMNVRLYYRSAINESGSTPSKSGSLRVMIGNQSDSDATKGLSIGKADDSRANTLSVSQLSCGFLSSQSQSAGLLFVLNMKIKSKASTEKTVTSTNYESWYPTGTNFSRGTVRDLRMKYTFRNLATRGVYQWRPQGRRNCRINGVAATDKSDCCSLAISGGVCTVCKAAGDSGSATSCCSEQVSAGICQ